MIRPSAIISDADGTLVDTVALIRHGQYETVKTYLIQAGLPTKDIPGYDVFEKVLHGHLGGSAHDTLMRTVAALYETQPGYLNRINFDDLHALLNPTQDALAPTYVKPYLGLGELFKALSELHIKLGIFTSGTAHHVVRNFGIALPELGLSALYKENTSKDKEKLKIFCETLQTYYGLPAFTVVTCEDVTTHKPNPESLRLALRRLDTKPKDSMVFGDHQVDMQAGANAGAGQCVGVTHGFHAAETLAAAGATEIVSSLTELAVKLRATIKL